MQLSVVIPTYNEEKRISGSLRAMIKYFEEREIDYEIIVSDGKSSDRTQKIVEKFSSQNPRIKLIKNNLRGKGLITSSGVRSASGDLILLADADLSTPIEEYDKLEDKIKTGADIAIGSRALPQSRILIRQPFYREWLGKLLNRFVRWFYLPDIRDTQCGFKLFKGSVAREIFARQKIEGFLFDVEVLYLARKRGYKIVEVPIVWAHSKESKVNVLRELPQVVIDFLRIKNSP
jgi:dolichyl-phosphate beta-glucosyltransferase